MSVVAFALTGYKIEASSIEGALNFAIINSIGAVMCFWQRHIKRLLAFSTISHVGMILAGCACLNARELAGAALYTLGHAMIKGSLFMPAGIFFAAFRHG